MSGLIEEIQQDAIDQKSSLSALLRKVKVAASKLDLPPIEQWVDHEINGYQNAPLPQYRELKGRPKALNPYQGWIPILLGNKDLDEMLASCGVRESVASLESLIELSTTNFVQFPIPPGMIVDINNLTETRFGTMSIHLSINQIHGLLDAVRNLVLEWALKLDRAGIRGEGMSFNREEKQLANAASNTFHIGNIGSMVGNLGIQNTSGAITASAISIDQIKSLTEQLQPHLSALKSAGANSQLLDASLSKIIEQSESIKNPDQTILRGALVDLRNALSGATGSLLASGAIEMISKMLGG